jgi:nucleoside-diphosphate-sugar epimerase
MNILITGATGFIGKNLLRYIKDEDIWKDEEIILLSSQEIPPYKYINHNKFSFTKEDFYKKGIMDIDAVIHMGAFIPKTAEDANLITESISNIENTFHLINNLPSVPKKFIFLSTIDIYQKTNSIIDEKTPINPNTLYGWSKLLCEKIIEQSAISFGFIPQILRLGHIYGPGEENYKKLIPETIKKIINNQMPVIYSDGSEKRSFLYIDDCCRMIIKALEMKKYVDPINVVSKKTNTVKDIVEMIIDISKKNISCIVQNQNIDTKDLVFSNTKMEKYLYSEKIALFNGLTKEYEYFSKINNV